MNIRSIDRSRLAFWLVQARSSFGLGTSKISLFFRVEEVEVALNSIKRLFWDPRGNVKLAPKYDSAATTSKSSQSATSKSEMVTMPTDPRKKGVAISEMVTMPTDDAKEAGPRKPVFHLGLGPAPKRISPLRRGEAQETYSSATTTNLSADWLRKVEWATSVIPNWQPSNKALALAKRQRSQEAPAPSAKKSRVQTGRSFAQIAKEWILIGVLDRGNLDGRIPRNLWRWVKSALATQCFELLEEEPGPPPVCKDVWWYRGKG
ncbi:hypothetical protein ACLKA6_011356 [Drosophila palustris]